MANANPSSPNRPATSIAANVPKGTTAVKLDDGSTVLQTVMSNGVIRNTNVFPGDHPSAKAVSTKGTK